MPKPFSPESIKHQPDGNRGSVRPLSDYDVEMRIRQMEAEGDAEDAIDGGGYSTDGDPTARLEAIAKVPTTQEFDTPEQLQEAYEELMAAQLDKSKDRITFKVDPETGTEGSAIISMNPYDRRIFELWLAPQFLKNGIVRKNPNSGARIRMGFNGEGKDRKFYAVLFQDPKDQYQEGRVICLTDRNETTKASQFIEIGKDPQSTIIIPQRAGDVSRKHASMSFTQSLEGVNISVYDSNSTNGLVIVERHRK